MKKRVLNLVALAALVAGLGMATSAHAAWTFTGASSEVADGTGISINSVSGAYATNGGTLVGAGGLISTASTYGINGFATNAAWTTGTAAAALALYSGGGLGMSSDSNGATAPNHAIDNGPGTDASNNVSTIGNTEAVLLKFSSSVVLNTISLGYKAGDADISLFRYTGSGNPAATFGGTGAVLSSMQAASWELVGNYGDLAAAANGSANTVNSGAKGSSWWLISAYNSSYGNATTGTVNQGDDYFKLYSVAGAACSGTAAQCGTPNTPNGVPEPTSLALVAIAGLGVVGARRRKVAAAA